MSRDPQLPPVGEEIHLPGGSIQPLLLTIGLTIGLVGVTFNWWVCAAGCLLSVLTIIRWVADTRADIAELPLHHGDGHDAH